MYLIQVVSDADVQELCSVTLQSGRNYTRNNPAVPLMYAYYNTEYLGTVASFDILQENKVIYLVNKFWLSVFSLNRLPMAIFDIKSIKTVKGFCISK